MSVNVTGPSIYFTIPILGGIPITQTTLSSLLVTIILCCGFVWIGKGLKKRPDGKQVLVEKGIMMLYNMTEESMGKHNAESWFPFICTMFLSSILGPPGANGAQEGGPAHSPLTQKEKEAPSQLQK